MWRAYTGVIHFVFDQIPNLKNCFATPNKPRRRGGLRHRPPKSVYWSIFKKRRHLGFGVFIVIWSMVLPNERRRTSPRITPPTTGSTIDGTSVTKAIYSII
jgi:hypothetical protein